jgi:hypothetical protein
LIDGCHRGVFEAFHSLRPFVGPVELPSQLKALRTLR